MLEISFTDTVSIIQVENTEGFDSHCLNSAAYFKKEMPDIDINDAKSVNSIAIKYKHLRQESKKITFAAQYGGTYHTFMNAGFSKEEALEIERNYHELYKVSNDWTNQKIKKCAEQGYTTTAFGLRIRTPLLKQVMFNTDSMPQSALAEARSVGNAISGQSYGMLNNRATNAFMDKVWKSKFKYSILPIGQIHDCTYFLIKDDLETLEWTNKHLIEEMEWQDLPEIQHPDVHLGAELDVCIEGWHKPITIPNGANQDEIKELLYGGY